MRDYSDVTVLTTPENADWYRSVLGDTADYKFSVELSHSLSDLFFNLTHAGGSVVVIEESHCSSPSHMAAAIRNYADDPQWSKRALRFIVVCPEREEGDPFLSNLVSNCGIYDIIYGGRGAHVTNELARLMERPNTRRDVAHLIVNHDEQLPKQKSFLNSQRDFEAVVNSGVGTELLLRLSIEPLPSKAKRSL